MDSSVFKNLEYRGTNNLVRSFLIRLLKAGALPLVEMLIIRSPGICARGTIKLLSSGESTTLTKISAFLSVLRDFRIYLFVRYCRDKQKEFWIYLF